MKLVLWSLAGIALLAAAALANGTRMDRPLPLYAAKLHVCDTDRQPPVLGPYPGQPMFPIKRRGAVA